MFRNLFSKIFSKIFSKKEIKLTFLELKPGVIIEFTIIENIHNPTRFNPRELEIRTFQGIVLRTWRELQTKVWMAEIVSVLPENPNIRVFNIHEHEIEKMRVLK